MKNNNKIKTRILFPVILAIYILVVIFYIVTSQLMKYNNTQSANRKLESISKVFNDHRTEDVDILTSTISILQKNKELQQYWLKRDRDKLIKKTNQLFSNFSESFKITHFYFHDTNSVNFLRLHNPEKHGDFIDRYTMKQARESGTIASGLEVGTCGTFTLKVVVPWYIDGILEGYIELGEDIEHLMSAVQKLFNVELFLLLYKKDINKLTDKNGIEELKEDTEWNDYNNFFLIYKSIDVVPKELEKVAMKTRSTEISYNDKDYMALSLNLQNINLFDVAKLIILLDVSDEIVSVNKAMIIIFVVGLVVSLILVFFFNFILGRIERDLIKFKNIAISEGKLREREQKLHIDKLFEDEKKLKCSEQKLRLVFENTKDAIIWANPKTGIITNCNLATENLLEYSKDEIIGQPQTFLLPEEKAEYYIEIFDKHILEKGAIDGEVEIVTKSGRTKYVDVSATVISVGDEEILQGTFRDITEQREIEKYIFESENRFQQVAEYSNSIVWEIDTKLKIKYINSVVEKVFGYTPEELIGSSLNKIFPNSRENYETLVKQRNLLKLEGRYTNLEYKSVAQNGRIIWIRSSGGNIINENGEFVGVRGISSDITEEKETEKMIFESKERFQQVADYSDSMVWEINEKNEYTYINSVVEKILGYRTDELIGKNGYIHFPECEENSRTLEIQKKMLEVDGKYSNLEFKLKTKEGNYVWVRSSGGHLKDGSGKIIGRRGISTDITEKKRNEETIIKAKIEAEKAEEKIRESEERNRSILEALPDILFIFNKDGVFLDYHSRSSDELRVKPETFLGKKLEVVFPNDIAELVQKNIVKTLSNKGINVFTYSILFEDKIIYEEARMVKYGDHKVLTMIRNITDIREAEKKLIEAKERAERADSLKSTFLAQMSHEIRTPINSIVSLSSIIHEEFAVHADSDMETCFNLIKKSGDRIIRTTDLILNLSEIAAGTYEVIKEEFNLIDGILNKLFNEYLDVAAEKNLNLKIDANLKNPIIFADLYTVEQIFCNIIDNAIKYTDNGEVIIKVFENKEERIVVEVIDSGIGISEEYLLKMFTPFSQEMMGYTRKYEGNGVGLALVKEYCNLNNVEIEVESGRGKGSTFRVIFAG